jgi:hypothetical protein
VTIRDTLEGGVMKSALIVLLLATSAFAQKLSGVSTSACGAKDVSFDVKLDKTQHTVAQPHPGKALVYFIQEKGSDALIGLDGAWVGQTKKSSYFAVSVEPGEHHVCAEVRTPRGIPGVPVGFLHFTAEAGNVYYFDARVVYGAESYLFLGAVDSDEARYLINSLPLSVPASTPSTPKKDQFFPQH